MSIIKQVAVAIDFYGRKYYGSQWTLVTNILQNIFLFNKRETHTGLEQQNDYPFRRFSIILSK